MEGDTMASFRESIEISAPPHEVWQLIADITRHPEFAGPKSITKAIDFDGPLAVGVRWEAHEKFGPNQFDAPSEVTAVEEGRLLEWVSYPPAKSEDHRGKGGICRWGYQLTPTTTGTRLDHYMTTIEARKGMGMVKVLYKVMGLPARFTAGGRTSLENIRAAAEQLGSDPHA